jgi:hypothetical protein
MLFLKLAATLVATVCVLVVFTYAWLVGRTRGAWGLGGRVAIDIKLVSAWTVHSPVYWLLMIAVLAAAWWLSRHWLFH